MRSQGKFVVMWLGGAVLIGCQDKMPLEPRSSVEVRAAAAGSQLAAPYLQATAVSSSTIQVVWQGNWTDESGFEIHRSGTGDNGTFALIATRPANDSMFIESWLASGTTYHYLVRAFRTSAKPGKQMVVYSAFSNPACATTFYGQSASCPPPGPTVAPDIATRPISSQIVKVEWTPSNVPNSVDSIRIQRSTDDGVQWTQVGRPLSVYYSYELDGGVQSERRVCHRVTVFNIAGETPPSNMACTTPPAGPTSLVATRVDDQTIDLTWQDNSAVEDAYEVWARWSQPSVCDEEGNCFNPCWVSECEENVFIAALPANTTLFRTGPAAGQFYVIAKKDQGQSDRSNLVSWPSQ